MKRRCAENRIPDRLVSGRGDEFGADVMLGRSGGTVAGRADGRRPFVNGAVELTSHLDQRRMIATKEFGMQQDECGEQVKS